MILWTTTNVKAVYLSLPIASLGGGVSFIVSNQ
jgi:hypothetical protein